MQIEAAVFVLEFGVEGFEVFFLESLFLLQSKVNFPHFHDVLICENGVTFGNNSDLISIRSFLSQRAASLGFDTVALEHGFHIIPIKLGRVLSRLKAQVVDEGVLLFGFFLLIFLVLMFDGLERFLFFLDFLRQFIR